MDSEEKPEYTEMQKLQIKVWTTIGAALFIILWAAILGALMAAVKIYATS